MKTSRQALRNFESQQRTEHLQFTIHELLQLTFQTSVQIVQYAANADASNLQQILDNAFEAYERAILTIGHLKGFGLTVIPKNNWLDKKWYQRTKKHIIKALDKSARRKLALERRKHA